jgi:hypothetical protein
MSDEKERERVHDAPLTMFPLTRLSSVAEAYEEAEAGGLGHLALLPDSKPFVVEELGRVRSPRWHFVVCAIVAAGWVALLTSVPGCVPCRACSDAECTLVSYNEDDTVTVSPTPPLTVENLYRARITPKLLAASALPGDVLPCFYTRRSSTVTFHVPSKADTRPWTDQCPGRFAASAASCAVFVLFACFSLCRRGRSSRCVFPPCELCVVVGAGVALVIGCTALMWW